MLFDLNWLTLNHLCKTPKSVFDSPSRGSNAAITEEVSINHRTSQGKPRIIRTKRRVQKYNPVKHLFRVIYWLLSLATVAVVLLLLWKIFTTVYEENLNKQSHYYQQDNDVEV